MKNHLLLSILILVLVSSGCDITQTEKIITWCDKTDMEYEKETFHEGKLWISSENFNGMNHAPAIRHFCREDKEYFFLEMIEWAGTAGTHQGKLISKKSGKSFPITSTNTDPQVKLIEEKNKSTTSQVWFTLDGKTFMYDENTDKFTKI